MNEAAKAIVEQTEWPKTEDSATADALIVHGARVAAALTVSVDRRFDLWNRAETGTPERKARLRDYLDATTAMIAESQGVIALREVQKVSPAQADDLARTLWRLTEDGGVLSEIMFECLSERGVDAQAVWDAAASDEEESRASDG
jgi:hypothetical protein